MDICNLKTDYEYFARLWEDGRPRDSENVAKHWDGRANNWELLLEGESAFKRSLDDRVSKTALFLRERGLLGRDTSVIDIGCGTGRFTTEFARTAGHVTGVDISENMLSLARRHAAENGIGNTSYVQCDFTDMNADIKDWTGKFDLVFASITAAISGMDSLERAIKMSKAYCFNSSFIRNSDELEKKIAEDVFGIVLEPRPVAEGRSFYALFNLLWLDGYCPETGYHRQYHDNEVPADDELAEYYEWSIFRDTGACGDAKKRIMDYLLANSNGGTIRQCTQRWYGWTLWDVRNKCKRRFN